MGDEKSLLPLARLPAVFLQILASFAIQVLIFLDKIYFYGRFLDIFKNLQSAGNYS
jgi:hypothetical protein